MPVTMEPVAAMLAGTNDHLALDTSGALYYTPEPVEFLYRPAIDVFFDSVVAHWRSSVAAVLLTGMGRDGAEGLLRMREAGATTIGQDEASCIVYGMPRAAQEIGAVQRQLPLNQIGGALLRAASASSASSRKGAA